MSLPDARLTIQDNRLGITPQDSSGEQAIIGVCSLGTNNTIYEFADKTALTTQLGTGPLVEAAALVLDRGGGPVICVPANKGTAGANGSVTPTGTGTSVMTVTGTPLDSYSVVVSIVTGAAAVTSGVGVFQVSLDGGVTFGPQIALPTSHTYAIPGTGLTLNFATGTLVAGDTYAFASTGPAYTLSDLTTALTALLADPRTWFMVHATGIPADTSAAQALFAALDSALQGAAANFRYAFALMQAPDQADSANITAFSALSSTRVSVAGGFATYVSGLSKSQTRRPASFEAAARGSAIIASEDPGYVGGGPLVGVLSLSRDEGVTPGLDAQRFLTLRTYVGLPGFFVTTGRMMSSPTSDFSSWMNRRVMDIACTTVRAAALPYINGTVRVNKSDGTILEADAKAIDAALESALRNTTTRVGIASDVTVSVSRVNDILSTRQLLVDVAIVPLGYTQQISITIGFNNPVVTALP